MTSEKDDKHYEDLFGNEEGQIEDLLQPERPGEEQKADAADGGPVDEDLFDSLMGKSTTDYDLDNIDNLYDEIMAEPSAATVPEEYAEPVLLGIGGREVEVTLAEPFSPADDTVVLHPASHCPQSTFRLNELDYLGLTGVPESLIDVDAGTVTEMVETFGGKSEKVGVYQQQDAAAGIYCRAEEPAGRFNYLFFPRRSIKIRYDARLFGRMLRDAGQVTDIGLERGLARQKKLRSLKFGQILAKRAGVSLEEVEAALHKAWREDPVDKRRQAGEILVGAGLASEEQIQAALKAQAALRKKKIGDILVELKQVDEESVYSTLAVKFRKGFVDLQGVVPSGEAESVLPRELAVKLMLLPLHVEDGCLVMATAHPEMPRIAEALHKRLDGPFELAVAAPSLLKTALVRKYSN